MCFSGVTPEFLGSYLLKFLPVYNLSGLFVFFVCVFCCCCFLFCFCCFFWQLHALVVYFCLSVTKVFLQSVKRKDSLRYCRLAPIIITVCVYWVSSSMLTSLSRFLLIIFHWSYARLALMNISVMVCGVVSSLFNSLSSQGP